MKQAVIQTGGKQYLVRTGDVLKVEKLEAVEAITFDKVLLINDGDKVVIGKPYVSNAKVEAKVLGQGRKRKVTIIKFKPKVRYRVKRGHRQPYTKVEITNLYS